MFLQRPSTRRPARPSLHPSRPTPVPLSPPLFPSFPTPTSFPPVLLFPLSPPPALAPSAEPARSSLSFISVPQFFHLSRPSHKSWWLRVPCLKPFLPPALSINISPLSLSQPFLPNPTTCCFFFSRVMLFFLHLLSSLVSPILSLLLLPCFLCTF